jgi:hypothetical protein
MGGVVSVERIDIDLATAGVSGNADTSLGQVIAKCVPFSTFNKVGITDNADADSFDRSCIDVQIVDNGGTANVQIDRAVAFSVAGTIESRTYVVEFDSDINVQSGTFTAGTAETITAVDQTKAFIVAYWEKSTAGDVDAHGEAQVRAYFASDTSINFDRGITGGACTGHYFVIEDTASNWDVQAFECIFGATDASITDTITSIDTAKTFLSAFVECAQADDDGETGIFEVQLTSGTVVTADRFTGTGGSVATVSGFAVTFDSGGDENVYRGRFAFAANDAQEVASHAAIDPDFSIAGTPIKVQANAPPNTGTTASSDNGGILVTVILNATDDGVVGDRATHGAHANNCPWETIEWAASAAAAEPLSAYTPNEQRSVRSRYL